ncbi:MAG: hypothetical protein KDG54_04115 [Geminicoccaceae bacterium]|nr:hypothetical protein [Geminicoccaceae bacterium]
MIVQDTARRHEVMQGLKQAANELQLMAIRLRCMEVPHVGLQIDAHDIAREMEALALAIESEGHLPHSRPFRMTGLSGSFG